MRHAVVAWQTHTHTHRRQVSQYLLRSLSVGEGNDRSLHFHCLFNRPIYPLVTLGLPGYQGRTFRYCSSWAVAQQRPSEALNQEQLDAWQCPAWWPPVGWVRTPVPIFRRLWTKVYRIKSAYAGVSIVCNAIFQLTICCCISDIFTIKSRSCVKSRQNFDVFGPPNFGGNGPPKFLTEVHKSGSLSNTWQNLMTMAKWPRRLGSEKKNEEWYNKMAGGQHSWRAGGHSKQSDIKTS